MVLILSARVLVGHLLTYFCFGSLPERPYPEAFDERARAQRACGGTEIYHDQRESGSERPFSFASFLFHTVVGAVSVRREKKYMLTFKWSKELILRALARGFLNR